MMLISIIQVFNISIIWIFNISIIYIFKVVIRTVTSNFNELVNNFWQQAKPKNLFCNCTFALYAVSCTQSVLDKHKTVKKLQKYMGRPDLWQMRARGEVWAPIHRGPKPGPVSDHHVYISLFCHILSPPDDTLFVRDIISIVLRCPRDLPIHELWGCWFCPGHMLNGDLGGVGWDPFSPSQSTPQLSKGSHRFILEQVFAGTLSELYPPLCITGNQQLTWDWCLRTEHGA